MPDPAVPLSTVRLTSPSRLRAVNSRVLETMAARIRGCASFASMGADSLASSS